MRGLPTPALTYARRCVHLQDDFPDRLGLGQPGASNDHNDSFPFFGDGLLPMPLTRGIQMHLGGGGHPPSSWGCQPRQYTPDRGHRHDPEQQRHSLHAVPACSTGRRTGRVPAGSRPHGRCYASPTVARHTAGGVGGQRLASPGQVLPASPRRPDRAAVARGRPTLVAVGLAHEGERRPRRWCPAARAAATEALPACPVAHSMGRASGKKEGVLCFPGPCTAPDDVMGTWLGSPDMRPSSGSRAPRLPVRGRHATSVWQGNWFLVGIGPVSQATQ